MHSRFLGIAVIFLIVDLVLTSPLAAGSTWPTDGWTDKNPSEVNMDPELVSQFTEKVREARFIQSAVVVRNGYRVAEEYSSASAEFIPHNIFSVTKSIISILVGIALDQGLLDNLDQPIVDFFPDYNVSTATPVKENITLRHLLTMSSGLVWSEQEPFSESNLENNYMQMTSSKDWVRYVLDLPMDAEPGKKWTYNTGGVHLLSAILERVTGMSTLDFALRVLFGPLGIEKGRINWPVDPQGVNTGGSSLQMFADDLAKIGFLFLNNGKWDGKEVVSKSWVDLSTSTVTDLGNTYRYGYLWWSRSFMGGYFAAGYQGQYIFVQPDQNVVVVFLSNFVQSEIGEVPFDLVHDYIIPACGDPERSSDTGRTNFFFPVFLIPVLARKKPVVS